MGELLRERRKAYRFMDERALNHSEMIRNAQAGDSLAFEKLAAEHQDLAYTLAYYLVGDEERAVLAMQSAFLRAYHELRSFRHGSFRSWLLRRVLESSIESAYPISLSSSGKGTDIQCRLLALPVKYRAAIILVDLLGLDYEEAACASGSTPKAVSHLLARARAEMMVSSSLRG